MRNLKEVLSSGETGPKGKYVSKCQAWLTEQFKVPLVLPTGSCTAALEMAAILCDLQPGEEVILPSFAYPSTATAFVRVGAKLVFADVDPETMNIAPAAISSAITERTRAIVVVHYAGIPCDMVPILKIADQHNLIVIEDAALAFLARYKQSQCGTLGSLGCFSFHESKSIQCGQGGALLVNNPAFARRAEIVLEKGTNRREFLRGETDRYTWQDIGSSYTLDNIRSAVLHSQLEHSQSLTEERVRLWKAYFTQLLPLQERGVITLPTVPDYAGINGHIFWFKAASEQQQRDLIRYLNDCDVHAVFHYIPLHSSKAGQKFGRFSNSDQYTSNGAHRLVRLPIFRGFRYTSYVTDCIFRYFEHN